MFSRSMDRLLDAGTVVAVICALCTVAWVVWQKLPQQEDYGLRVTRFKNWAEHAKVGQRIGPANSRVTIVEFGDYECPACTALHQSLSSAMMAFGDSLSLVYRHFPLDNHAMAYTAARAAECAAEQGRFVQYHDLLYRNRAWRAMGAPAFIKLSTVAEVPDSTRFTNCLHAIDSVISISRDLTAGRSIGLRLTPTLLINDQLVSGAPDSAQLFTMIRRALKKSRN